MSLSGIYGWFPTFDFDQRPNSVAVPYCGFPAQMSIPDKAVEGKYF